MNGDIRKQWEQSARGWARWEPSIVSWMAPATEAMLEMADPAAGQTVLDLACGAGSQTLEAARRVGRHGRVVASDIAEGMLQHVRDAALGAGLTNVSTLKGAAEDLDLPAESFDAVICRLGLILFAAPGKALAAVQKALRRGGKISLIVFTTPAANPFMAQPMQILLRQAGKNPPNPGAPGIFALGAPGAIEELLREAGFVQIEQRSLDVFLRMESAEQALTMIQEAFGAYRAIINDSSPQVQAAAWTDVGRVLKNFETASGFAAPAQVLVAAAAKPS